MLFFEISNFRGGMLAQKLIFRHQRYLVRVIAYYLLPWGFKLLEMTIYILVRA